MNHPIVSILMPVYNAEKYLREAVESILTQTLSDFELIILNDGSSDASHSILSEYQAKDARIVYRNFTQNRGLPSVLNDGMKMARGKYIARMDQDDISLPTRLQEQVSWMESHPELDVCGTWVELFGERQGERWQHPVDHESIYARMLFNDALAHPTVIMRTSSMREHNLLYDEKSLYIEDYELWSRALKFLKFANLGQVLLKYRIHTQNISVKYRAEQIRAHDAVYRRLLGTLQVQCSSHDLVVHQKIANMQCETSLLFLYDSYVWLSKISRANHRSLVISISNMDAEVNGLWREICNHVFLYSSTRTNLYRFLIVKAKKLAHKLACFIKPGVSFK